MKKKLIIIPLDNNIFQLPAYSKIIYAQQKTLESNKFAEPGRTN